MEGNDKKLHALNGSAIPINKETAGDEVVRVKTRRRDKV
jgi:hypothetical protein